MSLELKIEALTAAVSLNNEMLAKIIAGGAGAPAATEDKPARGRRSRDTEDKSPAESKSKISLDDLKAKANKFLDVADEEYEARVKAVFDPIFSKHKVEKLGELPEESYQDILDGIEKYSAKPSRRAL